MQKAAAELGQARQAYDRAEELNRRQSSPGSRSTTPIRRCRQTGCLRLRTSGRPEPSADIDGANAMLKLADSQLRDATIRAPFDGYVQKRLVSLGDFVKSQTPVMNIVRMDTLKATGEIPERMAPWVQVGQVVASTSMRTRETDCRDGVPHQPGREYADPRLSVRGSRAESAGSAETGTFARVHLTTSLVEPVLTIPYNAMQYRYGVYRVFAVKGDRLAMHELKTGDRIGDQMEILDGITLGEQIALTDVDNLADGMKVTVAKGDSKPAGPASE